MRCLCKDPKKRPCAADLLSHELFQKYECEASLNDGETVASNADDPDDLLASSFGSSSSNLLLSSVASSTDFGDVGKKSVTHPGGELDQIASEVVEFFARVKGEDKYKNYIDPIRLKRLARQLGIKPHVVIGHFDSKERQRHENRGS